MKLEPTSGPDQDSVWRIVADDWRAFRRTQDEREGSAQLLFERECKVMRHRHLEFSRGQRWADSVRKVPDLTKAINCSALAPD